QFEFLVRLDNMYVLSLENTSKFILLNLRCSFLIVSNYSGSSHSSSLLERTGFSLFAPRGWDKTKAQH
ncbi:hypothetical protein, partial [Listeria seeligeri]|uniref:hypothetical protein n=1 Tax=Listeria seeligeri TaxID=1640 RepID=UPI0022EBFB8E